MYFFLASDYCYMCSLVDPFVSRLNVLGVIAFIQRNHRFLKITHPQLIIGDDKSWIFKILELKTAFKGLSSFRVSLSPPPPRFARLLRLPQSNRDMMTFSSLPFFAGCTAQNQLPLLGTLFWVHTQEDILLIPCNFCLCVFWDLENRLRENWAVGGQQQVKPTYCQWRKAAERTWLVRVSGPHYSLAVSTRPACTRNYLLPKA